MGVPSCARPERGPRPSSAGPKDGCPAEPTRGSRRERRGGGRGHGGRGRNGRGAAAAAAAAAAPYKPFALGDGACYPLSVPQCPDTGLPPNATCALPAADHLAAKNAREICGVRQERRNPCWDAGGGNISCLPAVFLIGEMKCGTTTLYSLLGHHPSVVLPSIKEPRYLTLPKYRHHTGSWYASNFRAVIPHRDSITIDASPTVFNSPLLAPRWIQKWLPHSRLVVLLRDPVQRTYSHWRTGLEWLKQSPCYSFDAAATANLTKYASDARAASKSARTAQARAAASKAADAADAAVAASRVPAPIPEIRNMREVFSFDAVARLGVMEVVLRECGANSGWGRVGGTQSLSNSSKACVLRSHVGETVAGLWHARQALAAKRSEAEQEAYVEGMRRVSTCSEFMLRSGAGVWRSSRYAANLREWQRAFPKAISRGQLKVVATEELELDPSKVLNDVVSFLGLPPMPLDRMAQLDTTVHARISSKAAAGGHPPSSAIISPLRKRYCVLAKRGLALSRDDEDRSSKAWRATRIDAASDEDGDGAGGIGECDTPLATAQAGSDGLKRYDIEKSTATLLHTFFAPYNKELFKLIGRTLPWSNAQ